MKWKSHSHIWLFATHGLYSPWNNPGQNTGVGSYSVLQGIFPTQELNPSLPNCRQILYQLSHQGSWATREAEPQRKPFAILNVIGFFLIVEFSEFSYILDNNCLSDLFGKDFFTVQELEFYSLKDVFFTKEAFNFNNFQFYFFFMNHTLLFYLKHHESQG